MKKFFKARFNTGAVIGMIFFTVISNVIFAADADKVFERGLAAAEAAEYGNAVEAFTASLGDRPAAGTLLNLGLVEWRRGRVGEAVLSWQRAVWIDPSNREAQNNLRFAGRSADIELPELTWFEVASTWLPMNAWVWITGASLWLAGCMVTLPGILRWRRAGWHQTLAAVGLGVFLLSVPAHLGVVTRTNIGVVLEKGALLRLTPTDQAEMISPLAAGESARRLREKGDYWFVNTRHGKGWIRKDQFALVCPR